MPSLSDLLYRGGAIMQPLPNADPTSPYSKVPMNQRDYTPKSWQEQNAERLRSSMDLYSIIRDRGAYNVNPDPEFDWARKAEELAYNSNKYAYNAAQQRAQNRNIALANSNINFPGGGGNIPNGRFGLFLRAISGQESGGNYGAVNSDSGAMGKYQIMPSNIQGPGGWDMEALGRNITTQQFLNNPKLQEAIARHKLREYFSKYGARGAASAWYSGDPNKWQNSSPQGGYPSIAAYVASIIRRMEEIKRRRHGG